jgi:hypothetical protein
MDAANRASARRIAVRAAAFAMAIAAAGCLSLPLGQSGAIDPDTAAKLAQRVPVYDTSKLNPDDYIKVGSITAFGCDNAFLGGPGRADVVAQLRQKAASMGANGLTDLSCGHGGTSEVSGCFSSTDCSATALKVVPPAGSN